MTRQALQRKEDIMRHQDIIRAWKDEEYRLSLSNAERALLPEHPAGLIELTDADLEMVAGGGWGWLQSVWQWIKDHVGHNEGIVDDQSNTHIVTVTFPKKNN
jgi:mersacidin/lichenicidin family type 2 lantibiotic